MENNSRLSSSLKDKTQNPSKMFSSYVSHTRCESISKPLSKNTSKKYQKLYTQAISSRKYNSQYKDFKDSKQFVQKMLCSTSPYRTSWSSTKGRKKKSNNQNAKCQSSYNLKQNQMNKNMANSAELFNSLYLQPVEIINLLQKDKMTIRYPKKVSTNKQNISKRSTIQQPCFSNMQASQKSHAKGSKSIPRQRIKKSTKQNNTLKKSILNISPTLNSSAIFGVKQHSNKSPLYTDLMSRTSQILSNYQDKIKKLYEDKIYYKRMYEKSKNECKQLRKSLKKGNHENFKQKQFKQTHKNAVTKDTIKLSDSIKK